MVPPGSVRRGLANVRLLSILRPHECRMPVPRTIEIGGTDHDSKVERWTLVDSMPTRRVGIELGSVM